MKKMKQMGQSFLIACSMYSKVPMPKTEWKKENMELVLCFFPFVGALLGAATIGWTVLCNHALQGTNLWAIGYVVIPLLLTGGIHMDGFMDTTDARSSFQSREKKLEILKDPNAGAFAVIGIVIYALLQFGIWHELISLSQNPFDLYSPIVQGSIILGLGYILSRAISGFFVVSLPLAKDSGLAAMFSNEANKKVTKWVTLTMALLVMGVMLLVNPSMCAMAVLGVLCVSIFYKYKIIPEFGGVTGDLAGYFLQMCELMMAVFVLVSVVVR